MIKSRFNNLKKMQQLGWDFDGVINTLVGPTINSSESRVGNDYCSLNVDILRIIKATRGKPHVITSRSKEISNYLPKNVTLYHSDKTLNSKLKLIDDLKITDYFDDSNHDLYHLLSNPPKHLKAVYKVFPESWNDYLDFSVSGGGRGIKLGTGTSNPKIVKIPVSSNERTINVASYNIEWKITKEPEKYRENLKGVKLILKWFVENDSDFICLQESTVGLSGLVEKRLSDSYYTHLNNLTIESQYTHYNKKWTPVIYNKQKVIINGNLSPEGRPFTLLALHRCEPVSGTTVILINIHAPHKHVSTSEIAYRIDDYILKSPFKDTIVNLIPKSRIIMAGDFNRQISTNSPHSNSVYGLKLFQKLMPPTILYNIPYQSKYSDNNSTFGINTCCDTSQKNFKKRIIPHGNGGGNSLMRESHVDNILDSYGLHQQYIYPTREIKTTIAKASDHEPVFVKLKNAYSIF